MFWRSTNLVNQLVEVLGTSPILHPYLSRPGYGSPEAAAYGPRPIPSPRSFAAARAAAAANASYAGTRPMSAAASASPRSRPLSDSDQWLRG